VSRKQFDSSAGETLAQAVRDIEENTDAEIVIVVRGRSGTYRQADYLCGAIIALIGLIFVLLSPFEFHTYWVPFDVIGLFLAGTLLCSRTEFLRRALTTKRFRARAVRTGAAAMFYEAGIANTSAENGLLIYLSLLERSLEVIADRALFAKVDPAQWLTVVEAFTAQVARGDPADAYVAALKRLGAILAAAYPRAPDDVNEIPDRLIELD